MERQLLHASLYRPLVDEAMPDAMFVHDYLGRFVEVNAKACESVGYSRAELLRMGVGDIEQNFDLEKAQALWRRLESGETVVINGRHRRKDGSSFPTEIRFGQIAIDDEHLYIAVARDITVRVIRERALNQSEVRFRNLFDSMSEGYCLYEVVCDDAGDPKDLRHLLANPAYERHTGRKVQDVVGRTALEIYPDIEPFWIERYAQVALTGKPDHFQSFFGPLSRWFEVIAYRTQPGQLAAVFFDITERKHLEERLRLQAMVFANAEEGIVITDRQGCVVDANPAFERITEYRLEELRGCNLRILNSGRHEPAFYRQMWQTIAESGHWQGEIWNRRKSGDVFLQWESISAVRDARGEIVNYIGVSIDINRMRHAQSELERMAHYDALTGVANRVLLMTRLQHAIERVRRFGGVGALLFIDLDRFKSVNDTFGHRGGDEVLQAVSNRISERLRDVDTLARLGGDEFVVVLTEIADIGDAKKVADELIVEIEKPFPLINDRQAHIGASIGIAVFPRDGDDPDTLLGLADRALYECKFRGRGQARYFAEASSDA